MKPMLAKDADPSKLRFPIAAQEKLDGIRIVIVGGVPLTRTLKEVPNREVREALSRNEFEGLDGEIIVGDPTAPDAYRKTASFVMAPNKTGEPWCFHVFDKWDEEGPFTERWAIAYEVPAVRGRLPRLRMLPYVTCDDAAALEAFEADVVSRGHEGVILRDPAGTYKFGRSYPKDGKLLKLKRFSDSEAVILDSVEEQHNGNEAVKNALGRTERSTKKAGKVGKNTLGKLLVRDLYSGVEFSVGTGFTAQERADLWRERESLPGRTIRYKFFAIGVKERPRHPVMQGFREGADLPAV